MSNSLIIEWTPFEILTTTTQAQLIEAANKVKTEFLDKQPGFVRRELLKKDENNWVDLVYWDSMQSAQAVMQEIYQSQVCMAYFSLMEPMQNPEEVIQYFEQVIE